MAHYMQLVAFVARQKGLPFKEVRSYGIEKVQKLYDELTANNNTETEAQPTETQTEPTQRVTKKSMIKRIQKIREELVYELSVFEYIELGTEKLKTKNRGEISLKLIELEKQLDELKEKKAKVIIIKDLMNGKPFIAERDIGIHDIDEYNDVIEKIRSRREDEPKINDNRIYTAFSLAFVNYTYKNNSDNILLVSPLIYLMTLKNSFVDIIYEKTRETGIKFNMTVVSKWRRGTSMDYDIYNFTAKLKIGYPKILQRGISRDKIEEEYFILAEKLYNITVSNNSNGTNAILMQILSAQLQIAKTLDLLGGSYIRDSRVEGKKCVLNIHNEDNLCFLYCIEAFLNPVADNKTRASNYDISKFDIRGLKFPLEINQIKAFEKMNSEILQNRGINVYYLEGMNINNLRLADNPENAIDLLYLKEENNGHYCLITNFNAFCNIGKPEIKNKYYACKRCMCTRIRDKAKYEEHLTHCMKDNACRINLPTERNNKLYFKNYHKKLTIPFVIYYDFECTLKKVDDKTDNKTKILNKHEPNSFACYTKCIEDKHDKLYLSEIYEDSQKCVEDFIKYLSEEERRISAIKKTIIPMNLSEEEETDFKNATSCHICNKKYDDKDIRHRDHCHITGKYRGSACAKCNIKFSFKRFIPIVAHNSKGYDSHLIIKELAKQSRDEFELTCIASSSEKYISFSRVQKRASKKQKTNIKRELYEELRFIDSNSFLSSSLEKVAKTMKKEDFKILQQNINCFENQYNSANKSKFADALIKKGIYPYEFVDSVEKLYINRLPEKQDFSSSLYSGMIDNEKIENNITDKEYEQAQYVWNLFQCQNLKDYHEIYLKTDVLLLADIFENFRYNMIEKYYLDPLYSYTSPAYSWDACLSIPYNEKGYKINFELLTDANIFNMIENNMRGGISMVKNRYAKADDKTKIFYIDANNLYGWSMCQYLPLKNFKLLDKNSEKFKSFNVDSIINIADDQSREEREGYIFECDFHIPEELHDYFKEYPPLPHHYSPKPEELSEYQKEEYLKLNSNVKEIRESKVKKLCLTLHDKKNYVIHYRLLQLFLKLGVQITKIHNVISFTESRYLKTYIDKNTEYRKNGKSDFEKDLYKLLNNSLFGKTMENVRNRINFILVNDKLKHKKLISKPNYQDTMIFDDNLCGVLLGKNEVEANKPIYCGFSILDLSKYLMYDFFYNVLKKNFPDVKLLMTDTDSFIYSVQASDEEYDKFMKDNLDFFDTSDFPKDHKFYSDKNKKVIGKMKYETNEAEIDEFCGLGSKQYTYTIKNDDEIHSRNKGTKKHLAAAMNIEKYKEVLFNKKCLFVEQQTFKTVKHEILTISQLKLSLNHYDDKNYILEDGISTIPFGHYSIKPKVSVAEIPAENPTIAEVTSENMTVETSAKYDDIYSDNKELFDILYNKNSDISEVIKKYAIYPVTDNKKNNSLNKGDEIELRKPLANRFNLSDVNFIKDLKKSKLTAQNFYQSWQLKGYLKNAKPATLHENFNIKCNPYFDFEIKIDSIEPQDADKLKLAYAIIYKNAVRQYVKEISEKYNISADNVKIYSFDSSDYVNTYYKLSFHFIVKNLICANSPIAILKTMPDFMFSINGFDSSAYKSNQNMRFPFATKEDGSRPLKRYLIKNNNIKYISIDDIEFLGDGEDLADYCISNTQGAKLEAYYKQARIFTEKLDYSDDEDNDILDSVSSDSFDIGELSDSDDSDDSSDSEFSSKKITVNKIKSIIENIEPDLEYKSWWSVLCALYNVCKQNKLPYEKLAMLYCMRGQKFDSATPLYIRSIEKYKNNNYTIGTLFYFMRNYRKYIKIDESKCSESKPKTIDDSNEDIMNMEFLPLGMCKNI